MDPTKNSHPQLTTQIAKDTEALRKSLLLTQQLEQEISDLNTLISEQGTRMRNWSGTLNQSNHNLNETKTTLDQMDSWCLIS